MNQSADSTQLHVRHLAADYVLDLLSAEERKCVEEHSLECEACRQAILSDRQLAGSIRLAVQGAGRISAGRLLQLMPRPPRSVRAGQLFPPVRLLRGHRNAVLMFCMLLFVLSVGSILLGGYRSQQAIYPSVATQLAATATGPAVTATAVPSATSTLSAGIDFDLWRAGLRQSPSPAAPLSISTPVASASQGGSPALFP